jgi:hypothetical protein
MRMTNSNMVYKRDWIVTSILNKILNLYTFFSNTIFKFFWMVINMEIMVFNLCFKEILIYLKNNMRQNFILKWTLQMCLAQNKITY